MNIINLKQTSIISRQNFNNNIYFKGKFDNTINNVQKKFLNIKSKGVYPANILSNFSKTSFSLDGIQIYSIEGFLQALKTPDTKAQIDICKMTGIEAKTMSKSLKQTKNEMLMFWNDKSYRKDSKEFREILNDVIKTQKENGNNEDFIYKGEKIKSVNSFICGTKTNNINLQRQIFIASKNDMKELEKTIQPKYDYRTLYWKGKSFSRNSSEYQELLTKVYDARFKHDMQFRNAIRLSKQFELVHTKGKRDPRDTVLTEQEFIGQIKRLQKCDNFYLRSIDYIKYKSTSFYNKILSFL